MSELFNRAKRISRSLDQLAEWLALRGPFIESGDTDGSYISHDKFGWMREIVLLVEKEEEALADAGPQETKP